MRGGRSYARIGPSDDKCQPIWLVILRIAMIYLHRYSAASSTIDMAVVEDERYAPRYEAQGYTRCSPESFREAWRLRDEHALARLRAAISPEERAVGQL